MRAVCELAERVMWLTGLRSAVVRRELPADDPVQRCPDIGMAQLVLGWEPSVALEDGLARTVDYFRLMIVERGRSQVLMPDDATPS